MESNTKLLIEIQKEIQNLDRKIQRIEHRLEFSNKVVYIKYKNKEPKEN